MFLEIDCEDPKEVEIAKKQISDLNLTVVREWSSPDDHCCFVHLFWVTGTMESLFEVLKSWEDISLEEAKEVIAQHTRCFEKTYQKK